MKANYDLHPQTTLRNWGDGQAFRLADALTGVCVFGATGSGKTIGPAKHLAYSYLAADFGGLVLCAKKKERLQWQKWSADCGRSDDLIIVDSAGKWRFNFLEWEASRPRDTVHGASRQASRLWPRCPRAAWVRITLLRS
jgi:hypothetical protein